MDSLTIARALHVVSVVHWIGGVTLVTLVLVPALARVAEPERRLALYEAIEGRFARQARVSVLLAGITGFYMTDLLAAWDRFLDPGYWWMGAMVLLWAAFAFVLFIGEPLFLHAWFRRKATRDPETAFRLLYRGHLAMVVLGLGTVVAAVLGAHGMLY